ncbi:hypothetical protein [Thalassobellus suaedae]|uniref:Beta-lactamase-inhibitor-like PepSY-like domain-containing protein n=1 Tax=Thalassobellus suaedae TaxID=3074124 RepID=A0ABY9Y280_9FLAO|nr:hypothetical protein RHP49_15880 [Flavobacteriaceae bacterium HL-DH10]
MKQIIVIIVFVLFTKSTFSQNIDQSKVPAVVLNAFQLIYPNANDVHWEKEDQNYQIKYKVNSKPHILKMDYKGYVFQHLQDLYASEIPPVVLNTIQPRITYFDIEDADKYEKDNRITYEIKFKIDGKHHYFWVNEKGKLLKYRKELKDSEVPLSIMNSIKSKYGNIDIDYSKYVEERGEIIYIVRGEINDNDHNFRFDDKGNIVKLVVNIKNSEIPDSIIKTLTTSYKDYEIRDTDLIDEKGETIYILRIKKSKDQVYVTFNANGKILEVK